MDPAQFEASRCKIRPVKQTKSKSRYIYEESNSALMDSRESETNLKKQCYLRWKASSTTRPINASSVVRVMRLERIKHHSTSNPLTTTYRIQISATNSHRILQSFPENKYTLNHVSEGSMDLHDALLPKYWNSTKIALKVIGQGQIWPLVFHLCNQVSTCYHVKLHRNTNNHKCKITKQLSRSRVKVKCD